MASAARRAPRSRAATASFTGVSRSPPIFRRYFRQHRETAFGRSFFLIRLGALHHRDGICLWIYALVVLCRVSAGRGFVLWGWALLHSLPANASITFFPNLSNCENHGASFLLNRRSLFKILSIMQ